MHTHHSLSLSLSLSHSVSLLSLCSERAHISLSPLLTICSVSVQRAHTHLSLSLSLHLLSFCSARAHTSLSLSLCIFSVSVQNVHTHLSLSLYASAQFLFSARQRRAELNSVKCRYYVACFSNFTCKNSQNQSTAIVIILWVFYLIRQQLDYTIFVQINIL